MYNNVIQPPVKGVVTPVGEPLCIIASEKTSTVIEEDKKTILKRKIADLVLVISTSSGQDKINAQVAKIALEKELAKEP